MTYARPAAESLPALRSLISHHPVLRTFLSFLDLPVLAALYAYFMVTDRIAPWLWGLAVAVVVARWWAVGRLTFLTPLTLPATLLVVLIPITLWASADWSLTLPKVYGLLLSSLFFLSVLNHIRTPGAIGWAALGLMALGVGWAMLGLLGVDWGAGKMVRLPQLYSLLPRIIQAVPRSLSGSISINGVGGVVVFFAPLFLSLAWRPPTLTLPGGRAVGQTWLRVSALLALLITLGTLLLTQSRGAILGLAAGLLAWAIWRNRRWLVIVALIVAVLIFIVATGRLQVASSTLLALGSGLGNVSSAEGRFELWQRGMYMIQDFAFTGIGLGTVDRVVPLLYPLFSFAPDAKVTHVHNQLLEVAVDMGLPALVAYVALLAAFFFAAWRVAKTSADPALRALVAGLACGMLGHQVFGLTDAFLLGTKPALVMWIFYGVVAGIYIHLHLPALHAPLAPDDDKPADSPTTRTPTAPAPWSGLLWAVLYWLLLSLLAVSFIGDHFWLGLAIALGGGVIVGHLCTDAFERQKFANGRASKKWAL